MGNLIPVWSMHSKRGMTLVEVVLVLFILGILAGLGVMVGQGGNKSVEAAAEVVAAKARLARSIAMADHVPVALVVPSEGTPHARSFYRLEGEDQPDIREMTDLETEYPEAYLGCLWWPLSGGRPVTLEQDPRFVTWGVPHVGDHHLIFQPDGRVTSSGLPNFDNAFHLLLCENLEYGSANLGGRLGFRLRGAVNPYTVRVTLEGSVGVEKGVWGASGLETVDLPAPAAPAPARPISTSTNQPPSISEVDWAPRNDDTVPPGVDATVDVDHFLTLKMTADDPDGDPLYCTWEVDQGATAREQHRMEWDGAQWQSVLEWSPPPGASPGDRFTLTCSVEDRRGGSDSSQIGVSGVVETIIKGKVIFASDRTGNWDLYLINIDGTELRNLTNTVGVDEHNPRLSPDGTRIVYQRGTNISPPGRDDEIWIANRDGSGARSLTGAAPANWFFNGASFSPDGTRVAYVSSLEGGGESYFVVNLDGSAPVEVVPYSDKTPLPIFTPDGQGLIAGMRYPDPLNLGAQRQLVHIDLSTGPIVFGSIPPPGITPLVNLNGHHDPQSFSPDGSELLFTQRLGNLYTQFKIPFAPTGPPLPVENNPSQVSAPETSTWASWRAGHYLSENLVVKDQDFAGNWEIVKTDRNGALVDRLTNHAANDRSPDVWSP